jgi:hypothetical protein
MPDGVCPFAEQIAGVTTFSRGHGDRVGFCDHTAGGFMSTMRRASFWNGAGTSVHFAIGRDGSVIQLVNIFDTAFAQGRLGPSVSWPPYAAMGYANPNSYLISTEHEDAELVNGKTQFIPGAQWTDAQYAADLRVKRWCVEETRRVLGKDLMRFGLDSLTGHHMFDSVNRANCPGPYWRDFYRTRLYNDLMEDEMYNQHDAWALNDLVVAPGSKLAVNARETFGVPAHARRISLELFSKSGYGVILHGDSQAQAGRSGWSRTPQTADGYAVVPSVSLNDRSEFYIWSEDLNAPASYYVVHCHGWWA